MENGKGGQVGQSTLAAIFSTDWGFPQLCGVFRPHYWVKSDFKFLGLILVIYRRETWILAKIMRTHHQQLQPKMVCFALNTQTVPINIIVQLSQTFAKNKQTHQIALQNINHPLQSKIFAKVQDSGHPGYFLLVHRLYFLFGGEGVHLGQNGRKGPRSHFHRYIFIPTFSGIQNLHLTLSNYYKHPTPSHLNQQPQYNIIGFLLLPLNQKKQCQKCDRFLSFINLTYNLSSLSLPLPFPLNPSSPSSLQLWDLFYFPPFSHPFMAISESDNEQIVQIKQVYIL